MMVFFKKDCVDGRNNRKLYGGDCFMPKERRKNKKYSNELKKQLKHIF